MKLAIVHDFLNQYGGAERVVGYFHRIFPLAPIYTSIYFPESTYDFFKGADIHTSFLQKIPGINRHYRKYFMMYPAAFRRFDLNGYEIIITSSSSYANFIRKSSYSAIISYCHTPARFLWDSKKYLDRERLSQGTKTIIKPLLNSLRNKDIEAAKKVDYFITNSEFIKNKVKSIYGRDSTVIHPPIDVEKYRFQENKEDFYLLVSRLKGYKRVDIAVRAFNLMGKKLIIAGSGEDEAQLRKMASSNITFLGRVSEEKLLDLYANAKALVFPGEEDFGLTPLEAQASGTPVIAFGGGGALETVVENETGFFYGLQDPEALSKCVEKFEQNRLEARKCRLNAVNFDYRIFKDNIINFINDVYKKQF